MKDVKINNIANLLVIPDRYCKSKYIKSAFNKTFSVIFTDMSSDFGFPRIRRKKQNQRNHSRQSKKETDKTANQSKLQTIDLFRLYILFSQYRSCDDTQEIWSFVLFIKRVHADIFMLALMNKTKELKDQISWVSSLDLYWENKMYKRKRSITLRKSELIMKHCVHELHEKDLES